MFGKLGNMPKATSDNDNLILERFVVISYDQLSGGEMVNEARSEIMHTDRSCMKLYYLLHQPCNGTCDKDGVPSRLDVGLASYL